MSIVSRVRDFFTPVETRMVPSYGDWLQTFVFNGNTYTVPQFTTTLHGQYEEIDRSFTDLVVRTFMSNTVVFATEVIRIQTFSEARLKFRSVIGPQPGPLYGNAGLAVLEHPWTGAVTGDLLTRMLLYADFAGTAIVIRSKKNAKTYGELRLPRPDWFTLVMGSDRNPDDPAIESDAELIGVMYHPGGHTGGNTPEVFLPGEFAIFTPIPDPLARFRGIPWTAVAARDIASDNAMTNHKQLFISNGATPNMVVTLDPQILKPEYDAWVEEFKKTEPIGSKAYKTLYLGGGAKIDVVGVDMQKLDFKGTQGAGETRIAAASGVPSVIANLSEGLSGSSLNAGNYAAARRRLSDITIRPLWRNVCGSLESIVPPPSGSELWYDEYGIAFLREDAKDRADIAQLQASTNLTLVNAGWEPDSIVKAIVAEDWTLLKHTGLYSVQLQPPQTAQNIADKAAAAAAAPVPAPTPPARDAAVWRLLDIAERRAESAERRSLEGREPPQINVTMPDVSVPVTFERGAFEAPITIEQPAITVEQPSITVNTPDVHVEQPEITANITLPPPARRTVIDYDAEGNIAGSHEVPDRDD